MSTRELTSRMTSQQYAYLSNDQYIFHAPKELVYFDGVEYEVVANVDRKSGYQGTIYQRTDSKEFIVVHRGTEGGREPGMDAGIADGGMVFAGLNHQAKDAIAFTQYALEMADVRGVIGGQKITVTVAGHSLGGDLAQITAHKFNLNGETFNAYGAAGLMHGIPTGGSSVINHVMATDPVSAASVHYGEVRQYAAERDIVLLRKAGYSPDGDQSGIPVTRLAQMGVALGDSHRIVNFIPGNNVIGESALSKENQDRARDNAALITNFRTDVYYARLSLSPWEMIKPTIEPIQNWMAEREQQQQQAQQQARERQTERTRQIDAELAGEHGGPVMRLGTGHVIKLDDTPHPGIHRPDQFASSQEPASPSLFDGQGYAASALAQAHGGNAPSSSQAPDPMRIVDMPTVTVIAPRSQAQEQERGLDDPARERQVQESQEQQQWQQERQQQQLHQLQREEQRHDAAIQAATAQQGIAQAALGSGLLLSDPDHPAHEHYENARQGVVQVYSHQKKDLDDRVEPMAASLVAQAQRDGLSHINDVRLSADGQHLVASNTHDATAAHRETVQVAAAQAAHQSVADSSQRWAQQHITQAQEQLQTHTQVLAQVQARMQVREYERMASHEMPPPGRTESPAYRMAEPTREVHVPEQTRMASQDAPRPMHMAPSAFASTRDPDPKEQQERERARTAQAPTHEADHGWTMADQARNARLASGPDERNQRQGMEEQRGRFGPDHPDHPDHKLYTTIRGRTEALVARHGFDASEEQISRLVACTLVDVKRNKLADVNYLEFSENHETGKIGENLIACESDPVKVFSRFCATKVELAINTPIEDATKKLDAVNQDLAQKQEQQLAQEQQQEQSRSAHRIVMG